MRIHHSLRLPSSLPAVLLSICVTLLGGCGGYVLKGRAVVGAYNTIELVDKDDPRLADRGTPGVRVEAIRDPQSLGRKIVATANSGGDGTIRLAISDFGAGFLEEEWELKAAMGGASYTANVFELPFDSDSVRLLVVVKPGSGRAGGSMQTESERELDSFDIRLPKDSAIYR
ncbi:MAG: hypothetical protein GWP75_11340 [Planctomycetia bacterium]|jgi:hypothetical protein|nr:hypothetical protein [Planctomycetia bacterium]